MDARKARSFPHSRDGTGAGRGPTTMDASGSRCSLICLPSPYPAVSGTATPPPPAHPAIPSSANSCLPHCTQPCWPGLLHSSNQTLLEIQRPGPHSHREHGIRNTSAPVLARTLTSFVTQGGLLPLCLPQTPHLERTLRFRPQSSQRVGLHGMT